MRISDLSSDVCSSDLVLSKAEELPMPVAGEQEYPEDIRLRYRFLDLRRDTLHANIVKRTRIRSEDRRVGIECDSTVRSRGSPYQYKKNKYESRSIHSIVKIKVSTIL